MLRPIRFIPLLAVSLVLLALSVAGCGRKTGNTGDATGADTVMESMTADTSPTSSAGAPASDGEIAAIVKTANDAGVASGTTAEARSRSADVKTFARQMVGDHTAANRSVDALARKLNLPIQESRTSSDLKAMADAKRDSLESLAGASFDRAYVDGEVAMHEMLLNDLDQTLIPNAKSGDMRSLLQETRSAVANHLKMAQDLRARLGATPVK